MIDAPKPLFDNLDNWDHSPTLRGFQQEDHHHCKEFLYSYNGSTATFNAYRRELERFLHWSWQVAKQSIKDHQRQDIENYIRFCQRPPVEWIGTKQVARFVTKEGLRVQNPVWRPYVVKLPKTQLNKTPDPKDYQLSQKALQSVFAVLGSFYNYLIQEHYCAYNPVAQIRQKSKYFRRQQSTRVIRRLGELQWSYVIETTQAMAKADPDKHERSLFIMNTLYGMYLRVSELAASDRWVPKMGDFELDRDGNWWFRTVGKGNKERIISVSNDMLNALKRYRRSLGLSGLPPPGDQTPILLKARGVGPIASTRQIRYIVQACFDKSVERMREDGFADDAEQLRAATVHWLRHTGISDDVQHRPREHVRDDAGHGSSAITDQYIDVELRARHASAKNKKIHPDD